MTSSQKGLQISPSLWPANIISVIGPIPNVPLSPGLPISTWSTPLSLDNPSVLGLQLGPWFYPLATVSECSHLEKGQLSLIMASRLSDQGDKFMANRLILPREN